MLGRFYSARLKPRTTTAIESRVRNSFGPGLARQKLRLPPAAPPVTPDAAGRRNDAVTRDGECDRVGGAGPCHRLYCSGTADHACHVAVRPFLAAWNLHQRVPDLPLKRRRSHVEGQHQPWSAAGQMLEDRVDPWAQTLPAGSTVACGNSFCNVSISSSSRVPSDTAHTPLSVAATSNRPNGDGAIAKRIACPRPPCRYAVGVIPSRGAAPS